MLQHKKSNFMRIAFGLVLVTLLALVGLTDAKPVTEPDTTPEPAAGNVSTAAEETRNRLENDANVAFRGCVVDDDGKPVAGASVRPGHIYTLREQPVGVKTDAQGTFQFELESKYVNPNIWFHAVSEDQTLLGYTRIKFEEGDAAIPELNITLQPARVITGTVVEQDGKPVEGATVAGVDQITYPNLVTTNAEGKFRFAYPKNQLLRTLQEVYAYKEGVGFDYLCTEEIDKYQGNTPPEKISDGPFTLTLSPIKPVEIKVVNENNEPIPGTLVGPWLIGKEGEKDSFNTAGAPDFFHSYTNAEGIASLNCLPEWAVKKTRYSAHGPQDGVLQADGSRVYYGGDDKRMEEFSNLQISPSNVLKLIQTFAKDENSSIIPTFVLPLQARVKGTVKLPDGTPVPWARITRANHASCGHGLRYTDANGEFDLWENANEKLDLAVDESKFGATPGVFAFDVGDGNTEKRLDFVLEKGIRIYGTVYDLDGKPASMEFNISIYENDPNPEPCDPDSEDCHDGGCAVGVVIRQTSNYGLDVLDGKYEYLLPAVPRSYRISAHLYGADGQTSHEFALLGDEEEYEWDLYLKAEEQR